MSSMQRVSSKPEANATPRIPLRRKGRDQTSKPRLQFSRRTRIYLIPTLDELTQTEYNACYRTPQDENESQDHLVKTITTARQHEGGTIPRRLQDQLTTRGIEHMTCSDRMRRRSEIKKRLPAVRRIRGWQDVESGLQSRTDRIHITPNDTPVRHRGQEQSDARCRRGRHVRSRQTCDSFTIGSGNYATGGNISPYMYMYMYLHVK